MRILTVSLAAALLASPAAVLAANSPAPSYTLTTTTYSQDFDTLANSGSDQSALPAGFQIAEFGSSTSTVDGFYTANNGSSNTGDIYSYGATGSTERALGSLTSGTNGEIYFGGVFTNGTGGTIDSLTFGYTGEQWRSGNSTNDSLIFEYSLDAANVFSGTWTAIPSLTFTPLVLVTAPATGGALNGNLTTLARTGSALGLGIEDGDTFAFRWANFDSSGTDTGLAVDNFSITATLAPVALVPEPSTWALLILGFGAVGGAMRRRRVLAFA